MLKIRVFILSRKYLNRILPLSNFISSQSYLSYNSQSIHLKSCNLVFSLLKGLNKTKWTIEYISP